MKIQSTQTIMSNDISAKGFEFRKYKELLKFNKEKINNPI
jgi:hypothetical protein